MPQPKILVVVSFVSQSPLSVLFVCLFVLLLLLLLFVVVCLLQTHLHLCSNNGKTFRPIYNAPAPALAPVLPLLLHCRIAY